MPRMGYAEDAEEKKGILFSASSAYPIRGINPLRFSLDYLGYGI